MGPPKWWSYFPDGPGIPHFWGYGNLEIRFSDRGPHKIEWMKLARADELHGARVSLGRNMKLDVNGLDGRMPPSEIVRSDIWPTDELDIDIQLIAGELQLRIAHFPVEMLYVVYDDDARDLNAETAAFHSGNWRILAAFFEEKATLHSIGAFSRADWKARHWDAPILKATARDYLVSAKDLD